MTPTVSHSLSAVVTPGVTVVCTWPVLFHERKSYGTGGFFTPEFGSPAPQSLLVMSPGPRMMLNRKVNLFLHPLPVTQWKARSTAYFSTRSLCSAVDGQAATCQGELGSAALPVPSAGPESRAGSSSLSCKSHFRHTGRRRMV